MSLFSSMRSEFKAGRVTSTALGADLKGKINKAFTRTVAALVVAGTLTKEQAEEALRKSITQFFDEKGNTLPVVATVGEDMVLRGEPDKTWRGVSYRYVDQHNTLRHCTVDGSSRRDGLEAVLAATVLGRALGLTSEQVTSIVCEGLALADKAFPEAK